MEILFIILLEINQVNVLIKKMHQIILILIMKQKNMSLVMKDVLDVILLEMNSKIIVQLVMLMFMENMFIHLYIINKDNVLIKQK